jgi:starch synthase
MRYGTVPVVKETGGLKDTVIPYNEYEDEGYGFTFSDYNAHDMLHTIKRALTIYHDKDVWRKLVKRVMDQDFSWKKSANKYEELYKKIVIDQVPKKVESKKININKASLKQLMNIKGIGRTYAKRVINYRDEQGKFSEKSDLMKVNGIGKKKYDKIKNKITV